jgi:RND family efflux transporter MFP subunit
MNKSDQHLSRNHGERLPRGGTESSGNRSWTGSKYLVLIASLSLTALLAGGAIGGVAVWRTVTTRLSDPEFLQKQLQAVQPADSQPTSGPPPAQVRVASAQRKPFQPEREIIGRLVEVYKVTVASEVTGKIIAMPVEEGTVVVGGETVLAKTDDVWSRLAKQRIEAQMESAKVMLRFQNKELDRLQGLNQTMKDAVTVSQLELKQATVDELEATLRESQAAIQEEDERIARSVIHAPFDGIVVAKHVELGGHVTVGTPIVDIIATGELDARLMVPESVVNLLQVGQELAITVDPLRETVRGQVASVTPYGPMASRTFPVRVRLDDQEGKFKVGMSVTAAIPMDHEREELVVSRDAVLIRPDGATVWVALSTQGSPTVEVQPVPVTVNARMGVEYAVEPETARGRELLVDGAAVVIEGAERLKPGQTVGIVELNHDSVTLAGSPPDP